MPWYDKNENWLIEKDSYYKKTKAKIKYYFVINQCKECPKHDECAKKSTRKILEVGLNTTEFYEISHCQKTDEFKEKYKKRAFIEGKNAELKQFHGLYRTKKDMVY